MDNSGDDFTIPEILESFRIFDGVYKKEQINAAIALKDEITPHLIEILENVIAAPEEYDENSDLYDQIYALMLLGHFKEPKAHKAIVDLLSLPDDLPDQIFGDLLTSNFPAILLNTCGGSVELIKSLILNKEADEYCRVAACRALTYAVVEGYVSRESVLEFFGAVFAGKETYDQSDFWGLMASSVCDLYPEESMDIIRQAYDDGLIMPQIIAYSDFEEALKRGKDKCLEELKIDFERNRLDDIHATMSWWACFKDEKTFSSSTIKKEDLTPNSSDKPSSKTQKNRNKANRKKAKASKKKKRR